MNENTIVINRPEAPIPVVIIGGFLGAGKTTLLNEVLTADHGVRAAVLVNDFGAINIDAELVVGVEEDDTINLANGCVCCSIRDDLMATCLMLLNRPEPPEIILIETSGISDPFQVANTFVTPDFHGAFSINCIITLVDAEQFPKLTGDMAALAVKQIEIADFLVLNKVDLVAKDQLDHIKQAVTEIAPNSRILETTYGKIPLELVFDLHQREFEYKRFMQLGDKLNHSFATWNWTSDKMLSLPKLKDVLENLPDTVYRAKGIVYIEELPIFRYVFQMVGRRYEIVESGKWGDEKPETKLVLIGKKGSFDPEKLQKEFDACIGTGDDTNSPILRMVRKYAPELRKGH